MYKDKILNIVDEAAIIRNYFPDFVGKKAMFKNPLVDRDDTPSLQWYVDQKGWKFKAFNSGEQGDIWQFVAYKYQLDCVSGFNTVCTQIINDMKLDIALSSQPVIKPFEPKFLDQFSQSFIAFWNSVNVDVPTLSRFNVTQVASLLNGRNTFDYSTGIVSAFSVSGRYKVYIPNIPGNERWTKNKDNSISKKVYKNQVNEDIFGFDQLKQGAPIIICEGEKDTLVLAAKGFNVITFQSATTKPTPAVIERILNISKDISICYDTDSPGKVASDWICKNYGFAKIDLPADIKDVAEFFEKYNVDDFRELYDKRVRAVENKSVSEDRGASKIDQVKKLFHNPRHDRDGKLIDITIKISQFYELLISFGFKRYDVENGYLLVKIQDNIVEQVTPVHIQDYFFKWLESLPAIIDENPLRDLIKEKFAKGRETFFSNGSLSMLRNDREFNFCVDTKDEAYIFYKNGYVKCTKKGWSLSEYSSLDKYVWKNQILQRNFNYHYSDPQSLPGSGIFPKFIDNICDSNEERFECFCTIVGYLLHNYFEGKLKAIVFTDSSLQDGDNGRTGKTLVVNGLNEIKPTAILNGKSFDTSERFRYQDVEMQTQIIALNDVRRNFALEPLYNDITEKVFVERKNQKPFTIKSKFVIVGNRTIKTEGASARDRVLEFEFSGHYNDRHSPEMDFPNKWFFSKNEHSFSTADWESFDNFMCYCLHLYLVAGLRKPSIINLNRRKLIDQTHDDFVSWMDEQVSSGVIAPDQRYEKALLHSEFKTQYPDHAAKGFLSQQRNFNTFIKDYINLSGHFAPYDKQTDEQSSNSKKYIWFRSKQNSE